MATLATAVLGGCTARGNDGDAPPSPPAVQVSKLRAEPTVLWDSFTGRVAAPETVALRPRVSGYIERVAFTEGELVQQGDVLFEIDPRPYRAREQAAQAELARAQSQLKLADSEARRARQLLDGKAISREQHEQRDAARAAAEAAVNAAEAALESARLDLQYTTVEAPISGRVGRALVTRGNLAGANETQLTTLVSVDPMYVYFESDQQTLLNSRELVDSHTRPEVRIGLAGEDGLPHRGRLDFIDNRLNSQSGTIQFRAVVDNPDGRFRAGQFARVEMPVEHAHAALLVDRKAVLTDQDRRFVYVVDGQNRALRREVEPGREVDDRVVILSGLAAGDRVIVNGLQRVSEPGIAVRPQSAGSVEQDIGNQVAAANHFSF
ncbi:efflux RND transporter periplasmic adaptor subunit [Parahaliea aestuarii]|uniref:Efflux RND transporter periplasmic adaptor subunit n=1 Tax=Parahaliea aestuarii TaxID=1852021 RepID=A0A5C9A3N1_9GAMM|nr:efflux RND transporter periplasmic adaptor subunit [Parahaliea aestuarii]TXS94669.1 efflux RND transporter periplasmic adaptor subunit [Parahaliea aestuarii]